MPKDISSAEDDLFGNGILDEILGDDEQPESDGDADQIAEIDLDDLLSGALDIDDEDGASPGEEAGAATRKKSSKKKKPSGYSKERKRRRAHVVESSEDAPTVIDVKRKKDAETGSVDGDIDVEELLADSGLAALLEDGDGGANAGGARKTGSSRIVGFADLAGYDGYGGGRSDDAGEECDDELDEEALIASIGADIGGKRRARGGTGSEARPARKTHVNEADEANDDGGSADGRRSASFPSAVGMQEGVDVLGGDGEGDDDDAGFFAVDGHGLDGSSSLEEPKTSYSVDPISAQEALLGIGTKRHRRKMITDELDDEPASRRTHSRALAKADDDDEAVPAPEWVVSMRSKLLSSVAHAFLLEGNIRDYMVRNVTIKDGIVGVLDQERDYFEIIACYDQSHGLYFYGADEDAGLGDGTTMADIYRKRYEATVSVVQRKLGQAVSSDPASTGADGRDVVKMFSLIAEMFNMPGANGAQAKILLFVDYADLLVPDASSAQMRPDERKLSITLSEIGRSQRADEVGNCIIFLTDDPTQLSGRIRSTSSRIETVTVPNPLIDQRRDFIEHVLDADDNVLSDGVQIFEHEGSIGTEELAVSTAGLSCIQIEDIVLRSLADDVPLDRQLVKERKNEIIKNDYEGLLEIVDPSYGFERIGGLGDLKRMFMEEVISPIHSGDTSSVPMGILLAGPPGSSKSCLNSSEIYTYSNKNGENTIKIKEFGALEIGDYVFGRDGSAYLVQGVYPQGELEAYKVTLEDGRSVVCSADHLWTVYSERWHHSTRPNDPLWKTLSLQDMLDTGIYSPDADGTRPNRCKYFVPMNEALRMPEVEHKVDPYVVGAFLGDGCCTKTYLTISSNDEFIPNECARLLGKDVVVRKRQEHCSWHFRYSEGSVNHGRGIRTENVFSEIADDLIGYAHEKRIPASYKVGSIEQRYALIQGLFDADGTIHKNDRFNASFSASSKQLAYDVREVLSTLGISATVKKIREAGKEMTRKGGKPSGYQAQRPLYRVTVNCPNEIKQNLFRLPRKKERALEAAKHPEKRNYERVGIASVEPLGKKLPMTCIKVAAPDELFCVGRDCVVTHNTMLSKAVAKEAGVNFVALNLNRIMDKWVGSSERNLDRALDCAMAMAPTIIFIDEIDEALPNRNDPNQSSVNKRINQRLLTFFSETEHRGQVMILAATNYPDKIDPAFKRAGRFDMRLPMFAPDGWDRMRIILIIAKSRGYSFSWFEHPDTMIKNPFKNTHRWVATGHAPVNERFVGELKPYTYTVLDTAGNPVRDAATRKPLKETTHIPGIMIEVLEHPDEIPLWQFYRMCDVLFEKFKGRELNTSSGIAESDAQFYARFHEYLHSPDTRAMVSDDDDDLKEIERRFRKYDKRYSPFVQFTMSKTGAELDVVMNKAISLWRRWKKENPEKLQVALERGKIADENDIPYEILEQACHKTVSAVVGIKEMEDAALVNTSDNDYIPDAVYGENDEGKEISYRERQATLLTQKQTLI